MAERTLLAILGRGTQQLCENGPWEPTEDLEVCDEKFAHLSIRVPENDNHPNSIIGGGKLNILAAKELYRQIDPVCVVFAYGNRSKYLVENNFPSECQVMSDAFAELMENPSMLAWLLHIFEDKQWGVEGSGTLQELHNIFTLAKKCDFSEVTVATVAVHVPRTALMVKQHLPEFPELKVRVEASEYVLLRANPEKYGERVDRIFASKSYRRNLEREMNGMNDLLAGNYKPIASVTK